MTLLRRLAVATTVAVFILIAVGASVRAAGAGLGCPDWPMCFGRLVPPTDAAQLPEAFADRRADFDPVQTWIEYLNRLTGAVIGLLTLATAVAAFLAREAGTRLRVVFATVLGLVLFEAWLGALVVRHELDPRFVTVHLVVAIGILGLLLWGVVETHRDRFEKLHRPLERERMRALRLTWLAIAAVTAQIVLGALVRGAIDDIAEARPELGRQARVDAVGLVDQLHRKFALVTLVAVLLACWRALQTPEPVSIWVGRCARAAGALIFLQLAAGVGLAYAGLPPVLQVAHIALAAGLWGVLFVQTLVLLRLDRRPVPFGPRPRRVAEA